MEAKGQRLAGVRLDSGDLVGLSQQVRRILDDAGLAYVKIVVSGGLDEASIGEYLAKGSAGKGTWAAQKQVYRRLRSGEGFAGDVLALREEPAPPGTVEILLRSVMERGRLLAPHPTLMMVRDYCAAQVASLPEDLRDLRETAAYPVSYSERLVSLQHSLEAQLEAAEVAPS